MLLLTTKKNIISRYISHWRVKSMTINPTKFLKSINSIDCEMDSVNWKILFYQEFAQLLVDSDQKLNADVRSKLHTQLQVSDYQKSVNFRTELIIRSVPFLVGFFFDRKEIRLYTPKLSQELFLLQQSEILELESSLVKELRIHAELAASLQVKKFPTVIETITSTYGLPDLLNDPIFLEADERSAIIVKKLLGFFK